VLLDHGFQRPPQRHDVERVRLELQRAEDAPADRGDVGVAGPARDGELVRYLDQIPD
jgi:hypothetical protein